MNALNYTLKEQCLPSMWQTLTRHLPAKRKIANIQLDIIKTLNPLGEMKVTPKKTQINKSGL